MKKIIEVRELKKSYGTFVAVEDLNFYVEEGSFFAFLGPNGAGKSTTIEMISTFLKPDSGHVIVNGYEIGKQDNEIRQSIGVVFQNGVLDDLLTIKENLELRGKFYGLKGTKLQEAIDWVEEATTLGEIINRPYGKLSGGQKRRADIARALIHRPKILFLDEPTTGLDPQTRQNVWKTIRKLQEKMQMTIFLTTHYMEEASRADYIVIVDRGKIAVKGTPLELKRLYAKDVIKIKSKDSKSIVSILKELKLSYKVTTDLIFIPIQNTMEAIPILNQCSQYMDGFEVINGTMDDVFIKITGKEIRE